jgi:hypothetical protein
VTAAAVGRATITGTYSGKSGTVRIDVKDDKWTVTGWVGAWLKGGWVKNARVRIGNSATATTNADGKFELTLTQSGTLPVVVEASGFHKSQSQIRVVSPNTRAQRNIIPRDSNVFDLNFHDHVFRDKGARGTRRWVSKPTVEIWTTEFRCLSASVKSNGVKVCAKYEATGTSAPSSHESRVRSVISSDVPGITANELAGLTVRTKSHAAGTIIDENSFTCWDQNKIVVVYIDMDRHDHVGYASYCNYTSGERHSSRIVVKPGVGISTYRHEVAHTLGWGHPDGYNAIPRSSIMGSGVSRMTKWDKNHGKMLYRRPPNSRTPDKDPPGKYINLFTARGVGVMPKPGVIPSDEGWPYTPVYQGPLIEETVP